MKLPAEPRVFRFLSAPFTSSAGTALLLANNVLGLPHPGRFHSVRYIYWTIRYCDIHIVQSLFWDIISFFNSRQYLTECSDSE